MREDNSNTIKANSEGRGYVFVLRIMVWATIQEIVDMSPKICLASYRIGKRC